MATVAEIHERHDAVREVERKLLDLQQVPLVFCIKCIKILIYNMLQPCSLDFWNFEDNFSLISMLILLNGKFCNLNNVLFFEFFFMGISTIST